MVPEDKMRKTIGTISVLIHNNLPITLTKFKGVINSQGGEINTINRGELDSGSGPEWARGRGRRKEGLVYLLISS